MSADCGNFYLVLPLSCDKNECSYLLLVLSPLGFSYYGGFLRVGSDDIRRMITLAIPEFTILADVHFPLYAAK